MKKTLKQETGSPKSFGIYKLKDSLYTQNTHFKNDSPLYYLISLIFPKDYVTSVEPTYPNFVKYSILASSISSASGVIASQSLLVAINLDSSFHLSFAPIINWTLKDGLGQIGTILYASYRTSFFLEVLTSIFPNYFLLFATLANIFTNISWIGASATKATIHKSFTKSETSGISNLADLTAKDGSQTVLAGFLGSSIGLVFAPFLNYSFGVVNIYSEKPQIVLIFAFILYILHLLFLAISLRYVIIRSLNGPRLLKATFSSVKISSEEVFFTEFKPPSDQKFLVSRLFYWNQSYSKTCSEEVKYVEETMTSLRKHLIEVEFPFKLRISPKLTDLSQKEVLLLEEQLEEDFKYFITIEIEERIASILIHRNAKNSDVLEAVLCSILFSKIKTNGEISLREKIRVCRKYSKHSLSRFIQGLKNVEWDLKQLFLEESRRRIEIE
eukprot:snap_masked-scaffold_31-processed-gene-2.33-mRNA-1 protein AED:1.00 eAED:1.00 QI:0/0/0/0/1/1/2/0/441